METTVNYESAFLRIVLHISISRVIRVCICQQATTSIATLARVPFVHKLHYPLLQEVEGMNNYKRLLELLGQRTNNSTFITALILPKR